MAGFSLSDAALRRMREAISRFPTPRAGILHALWIVQEEAGHVSREAMEIVASEVGISPAHVLEVVTFYTMFHTEPPGKHVFQVCRTLSCELMGAGRILDHLRDRHGIDAGKKRSADGLFTLQEVECLAACGRAPAMQVDDVFYESVTEASVDGIVAACREGKSLPKPEEGVPGWTSNGS